MNPLLDFSGLPRFAEFKAESVTPALEQLLAENRATVDALRNQAAAPDWDNFVAPLDDGNERLRRAWGQVAHMNAVMNSPQLRDVYNENLPRITQYFTELAQDEALFRKYKALRASAAFPRLTGAQKKVIDNELRDFRLGGAELPAEQKAGFKQVIEKLAGLSSKFNDNVLDSTNAFELIVADRQRLAGIPDDALEAAADAAKLAGKPGWKFTLHMPSYLPVMQYADDRPLREQMYHAYVTRAAEFGDSRWDNSGIIVDILRLRREQARLLGLASFAELSLQPKMADSPQQGPRFSRRTGTTCQALCAARPGGARGIRVPRTRARRPSTVGCRLCVGKTARRTLRVFRPGGEAVLPRAQGARRHVSRGRDALWPEDRTGCGAALA